MNNEIARPKVILDGKQAEQELDNLTAKAKKYRDAMMEASAAGDSQKEKRLQQQLRATNTEIRNLKKEAFDVDRVLKNINGASFNELSQAVRKATNDLKKMKQTDPGYTDQQKKVTSLKTKLADLNNEQKVNTPLWSRMADGANKYFQIITIGIAAMAGAVLSIKAIVQSFNDYEERVSNLSALTGLKGDPLKWLSDKAKELSTTTLEGGIRITKGAQDIVDAFTKMGSARPDLLKNKEALAQTTEKALILAEAAKIETVPAIEAVAAAMNQFNLDASQSDRIINAIAAGSLEGSAEVADITESMKNVGTVAADSNMTLEQTVAVLEVLGEKQLKGAEAGTKLRGALLKMKDAGVGYASGQFNVRDAIIEVNEKLASQTSALEQDALKQKVFGIENVTVGTVLLGNVDKYDKLTAAVTGTSVAYIQAATNTDNNKAKLAQASNKLNIMSIELGEKLAPALTVSTSGLSYFIKALSITVDFIVRTKGVIVPLIASVAAYAIATKLAVMWKERDVKVSLTKMIADKAQILITNAQIAVTQLWAAAQMLLAGNINGASQAMRVFSAVTKLNPIGFITGLIIAAVAALIMFSSKLTDVQQAQKAVNDVNLEAQKAMVEEKIKVEQLLKIAKNENLSKETRLKAIKDLNDISPQYLGNLTLEKINSEEAKKATDSYIESIKKKAKTQAATEKLVEIEKQLIDLQNGEGADSSIWQDAWNIAKSGGNATAYAVNSAATATKNLDDKTKALLLTKKKLNTMIENENNPIAPVSGPVVPPSGNGKPKPVLLTPEEIKAAAEAKATAEKAAQDALELAYKQQQLLLKQKYADDETIQKEYHARMLANELAYMQAKLQITTDEGSRIDLQSQIIDKQQQYTAALKEAVPEILKTRDGIEKLNGRLLEESKLLGLASQKQKEGSGDQADYTAKQVQQADTIKMIGDVMTDYVTGALNGSMDEFQTFGDTLVLMSLQILKQMVPIWSAQILGLSLASPESVASWGIAGMAKYALITGLMYAGIGLVEGMVKSGIDKKRQATSNSKQSGGFSNTDGPDYQPDGIYHKNEFIGSGPSVRNPTIKPIYDIINLAQQNGTIATLNLPAVMAATGILPTGRQSGGFGSDSSSGSSSPVIIPFSPASGDAITASDIRLLRSAIEMFTRKKLIIYTEKVKKDIDELEYIEKNRGL